MVFFESKAQLSKRTKMYESELKWRMIYQRSVQGLTERILEQSVPKSASRSRYFVTRKSHNSEFITNTTGRGNGRIRTPVSLHSLLWTPVCTLGRSSIVE